MFSCNQCGRDFGTAAQLVAHLREGCEPIPEMEDPRMADDVACLNCEKMYYNEALPCGILGFCPFRVKR